MTSKLEIFNETTSWLEQQLDAFLTFSCVGTLNWHLCLTPLRDSPLSSWTKLFTCVQISQDCILSTYLPFDLALSLYGILPRPEHGLLLKNVLGAHTFKLMSFVHSRTKEDIKDVSLLVIAQTKAKDNDFKTHLSILSFHAQKRNTL